jgi:hypothetical protein
VLHVRQLALTPLQLPNARSGCGNETDCTVRLMKGASSRRGLMVPWLRHAIPPMEIDMHFEPKTLGLVALTLATFASTSDASTTVFQNTTSLTGILVIFNAPSAAASLIDIDELRARA